MNKQLKVLFISAPFGSGHIRAAQAVIGAIKEQNPCIDTRLVNIFDFFPPILGKTVIKLYLRLLDIYPQAYGKMYGWGNKGGVSLWGREFINSLLAKRMYAYIKKYSPDVIVCTHATPSGLIAYLTKRNQISQPTVAIVTDFVVHRWWIYPEIRMFCVANEAIAEKLTRFGISRDRSYITGIPVDVTFTRTQEREKIFAELELANDSKTVLIMGGGAGVLPMDEIVTACDKAPFPFQMIVVTGNNSKMFKRISALKSNLSHSVKILGYVNNVDELMTVSDILISKPGGMTSAEALSMGLPMIIYRPIPGQEEENTKFLVERNVAIRADNISEVKHGLELMFSDHELFLNYKKQAAHWGKPAAAQNIAKFVIMACKDLGLTVCS